MKIIKFVVKMIALAVIGIAFAIAGAFIGGRVLGGDAVGFGALGLAIGGILIGFPLGTIVGLILLRKLFHQKGSLWLGMSGAIVGTIATAVLSEPLNLNANVNLLFGVFFTMVPALTLGGFYLMKR